MRELEKFKQLFSTKQNVLITVHHNPDADALGSALGLASILKKQNHKVDVVSPNDYPDFLKWMKGNDDVLVFDNNMEESADLVNKADVIFCLDFSNLERIGELGELVDRSNAIKVMIDHHLEPKNFADFEKWSIEAGATAELIYDLVEEIGWTDYVEPDEADCLYAGILTDTGGFKHPNTTRHIHEVVAKLIDHGANTSQIAKLIYDTNTEDRLRLMGFVLSQRLVVLKDYDVAYIYLTLDDQKKFNVQKGDTEGLVNYALSIANITMAAMFTEAKDAVRISFRSIGSYSVNEFARAHFNGGGHNNAAGGRTELSLEETIEKFKSIVINKKKELQYEINNH
ncbi:MAG: DHH family phosphoesterase [Bacteroidota bacterium]